MWIIDKLEYCKHFMEELRKYIFKFKNVKFVDVDSGK